jgi:hypothetical protein
MWKGAANGNARRKKKWLLITLVDHTKRLELVMHEVHFRLAARMRACMHAG